MKSMRLAMAAAAVLFGAACERDLGPGDTRDEDPAAQTGEARPTQGRLDEQPPPQPTWQGDPERPVGSNISGPAEAPPSDSQVYDGDEGSPEPQ